MQHPDDVALGNEISESHRIPPKPLHLPALEGMLLRIIKLKCWPSLMASKGAGKLHTLANNATNMGSNPSAPRGHLGPEPESSGKALHGWLRASGRWFGLGSTR